MKILVLGSLVRGIATKELFYLQEMAIILESSIMKFFFYEKSSQSKVAKLEKWYLAVSFCCVYGLPFPSALPKVFARNQEWFLFVLCLDLFRYPYEQVTFLLLFLISYIEHFQVQKFYLSFYQ